MGNRTFRSDRHPAGGRPGAGPLVRMAAVARAIGHDRSAAGRGRHCEFRYTWGTAHSDRIAILLVAGLALVHWYAWRPLPERSGMIEAPLGAGATVNFDTHGEPHIQIGSPSCWWPAWRWSTGTHGGRCQSDRA